MSTAEPGVTAINIYISFATLIEVELSATVDVVASLYPITFIVGETPFRVPE